MGEEAASFLLYDFGYTISNDTVVVTKMRSSSTSRSNR